MRSLRRRAPGDTSPSCFWRKQINSITRYRVADIGSGGFEAESNTGVLRAQKTDAGGTGGYDYVPHMDGVGSLSLTDLDIRRMAATFSGT
jgi:hypothetical protein